MYNKNSFYYLCMIIHWIQIKIFALFTEISENPSAFTIFYILFSEIHFHVYSHKQYLHIHIRFTIFKVLIIATPLLD